MNVMTQLTLPITGMTCGNCVATIQRNLKKLDGVHTAVVNLSTAQATVEYDPSQLGLPDIIAQVQRSGYGVAMSEAELSRTVKGVRLETGERQPVQQNAVTSIWHFIRHFLEMCFAMCLGFIALGGLSLLAFSAIGYSDPINQLPELSVLVGAFNMTLPMAAWMRYRGMAWRPTIEMSAAMVVEAILLIGIGWLGILPMSSLFVWQHILMMPAMLIPMILRLDVYTGRACHSM